MRQEGKGNFNASLEENILTLKLLSSAVTFGNIFELRNGERPSVKGMHLTVVNNLNLNREYCLFVLYHQTFVGSVSFLFQMQLGKDILFHYLSYIFRGYKNWYCKNNCGKSFDVFFVEYRGHDISLNEQSLGETNSWHDHKKDEKISQFQDVEDADGPSKEKDFLMHSFESLHTADSYSNQLNPLDDESAEEESSDLSEITLKRSSQEKKVVSFYKADDVGVSSFKKSKLLPHRKKESLYYPEWNFKQKGFQSNFCRLYEIIQEDRLGNFEWKRQILKKYGSYWNRWDNLFLFFNDRIREKKQLEGEDVDIDLYIRYLSDVISAGHGDSRIFQKLKRGKRDISTLILLDQSMSTGTYIGNQKVLDIELEGLGIAGILFEKFGDSVCVAGAWSETRNHCYFQIYKNFTDEWSDFFQKAPYIEPVGYTRLGPSIRHSINLLKKTRSKTKLLLLLTDGKPTDCDFYEGMYGIEDIQHAFKEARQHGVYVKALTIEKEAKKYFPLLFGNRNYEIVTDPKCFPDHLLRLYLGIL
ncbi:MAG: hypothetical protein HYS16_00200 [Deltaproteobacteria bacterium]|nr:MAG: hypothetical protein HYS16_00200 [Deltaproteobacteria bacterium]